MNKIYGYLRISTDKQDITTNKAEILLKSDELQLKGNVEWIQETISGTKDWKKRELGKLYDKLIPGDVIITSEISRFARTIQQIMEFISKCAEKKIKIYCTKTDFKIDESIQSQMIIFAYALSAQIERDLISSRTKTALQKKKAEGVKLGRKSGVMVIEKNLYAHQQIENALNNGVKKKVICKNHDITMPTLNKYIKKYNLNDTQ